MKTKSIVVVVALLLAFAATAVRADIVVVRNITSKGLVGLANMEGSQEEMIAGDRAKTISEMRMTNKVMKFLGGGKPQKTEEITRLDKELIWSLDDNKKEYTEMTFAQMRAMMEQALQNAEKEKTKYKKEHPEDSVSLRTEVKVEHPNKTQKIAGYECHETVITMNVYAKNAESNESGVSQITMDLWMADDVPGAKDLQNFYSEMADKLGMRGYGQQSMEGMLTSMGVDPREIYKQMHDVKGFPMETVVSLGFMADTTGQGAQPQAKEQPKEEEQQSDEGGVSKKLGGLFGKKKKDSKDEKSAGKEESPQSGPVYLMQFTSKVSEITTGSVDAGEFEVPAGYKLKK